MPSRVVVATGRTGHAVVAIAGRWWPRGSWWPWEGLATIRGWWWPWERPATSLWPRGVTGGHGRSPLQDEDGNTLSDEDISAEADTFMFEGEGGHGVPSGGTRGRSDVPSPPPCPRQGTTRRPAAWPGCSTTWPTTPSTRSGAARRPASSSRAGTWRRSSGERPPPPRCHRPLGHPARGPPVSLSCTLPPPGTTCPACPSPPCASRRASACTPRSPPCPGAAPRTSPCVTGASSPRVSPEVSPTSPTSPSLRSPVRNAAPCPSHQGSSA